MTDITEAPETVYMNHTSGANWGWSINRAKESDTEYRRVGECVWLFNGEDYTTACHQVVWFEDSGLLPITHLWCEFCGNRIKIVENTNE